MRKDRKFYAAGDKVHLTQAQAFEARHALVDGPTIVDDPDQDYDEDEEEALDSIRRSPDSPESGVRKHWVAPGLVTHRPDDNKTEMEREREVVVRKAEVTAKAKAVKPPKLQGTVTPPKPVVPVATRPAPTAAKTPKK